MSTKKPRQQDLFAEACSCPEYRKMIRMDAMMLKRPERQRLQRHYEACASCRKWTDEGGAEG